MGILNYFYNFLIINFIFLNFSFLNASIILTKCPFIIQNTTITNQLQSLNFSWDLSLTHTNLTSEQLNVMFAFTNIALYNQTGFSWNFTGNLNDGKGITFGIIGFTSGGFDGRRVIERINKSAIAKGITHILANYYPIFQNIDNTEHDIYGNTSFIEGLENFIDDFGLYGNDEISKQAQLDTINDLYWQPALNIAKLLNVNYTSTVAQFFDICLNHGCDGDGFNNKGLNQLINETNYAINGNLSDGLHEKKWLSKLIKIRQRYIDSDSIWNSSRQRVELLRRLGESENVNLTTPIEITCIDVMKGGEKLMTMLFLIIMYIIALELFI